MAGISFMDSSPTIRRYDLSRRDRNEIMLLIDPAVSPVSISHEEEDEEDEKWKIKNMKEVRKK